MNDFTAIANANEADNLEISNISFFPAIDINDVRKTQRLDGTVTTQRLKTAIASAIIAVNDDLYNWRLKKQAAGITSINNLNDEQINGESKYLILYKRAVYSWANALLSSL